jgi:hypothetical protein
MPPLFFRDISDNCIRIISEVDLSLITYCARLQL